MISGDKVRQGTAVPRAAEVAYEKLCDAIVDLQLAPGVLVNERDLGERLGVSRLTPPQALHRVAETGLVSILPRRGLSGHTHIVAALENRDPKAARAAVQKHLNAARNLLCSRLPGPL